MNLLQYAKFYAQYQGQKGTEKQCQKLISLYGDRLIRMAEERGFKPAG